MGTAFLQRSSKAEPGLYFGFYESPERLVANAASVGIDLRSRVKAGDLEVVWRPTVERIIDSLGNELIELVRRRKVRRLFIDGWGGFAAAAESDDRLPPFFSAITNELRSLGVTSVCAMETENLIGPELNLPIKGISAVTENMILLRFAEYQGQLRRLISIMKVRGSSFDHRLRQFDIGPEGLFFNNSLKGAEGLLSGYGSERAAPRAKTTATRKQSKGRRSGGRRRTRA
jgi:circadian clock protein KaiC